jgi:hypothetical protein
LDGEEERAESTTTGTADDPLPALPELNGRRPVDRDFDNVANNVSLSLLLSEALLLLSEEELLDEVAV